MSGGEREGGGASEGAYRDAAVAADDGHVDGVREGEVAEDLSDERLCADDVESGHTEDPGAMLLRKVPKKSTRVLTSSG